jgi:hypothetical protein
MQPKKILITIYIPQIMHQLKVQCGVVTLIIKSNVKELDIRKIKTILQLWKLLQLTLNCMQNISVFLENHACKMDASTRTKSKKLTYKL